MPVDNDFVKELAIIRRRRRRWWRWWRWRRRNNVALAELWARRYTWYIDDDRLLRWNNKIKKSLHSWTNNKTKTKIDLRTYRLLAIDRVSGSLLDETTKLVDAKTTTNEQCKQFAIFTTNMKITENKSKKRTSTPMNHSRSFEFSFYKNYEQTQYTSINTSHNIMLYFTRASAQRSTSTLTRSRSRRLLRPQTRRSSSRPS